MLICRDKAYQTAPNLTSNIGWSSEKRPILQANLPRTRKYIIYLVPIDRCSFSAKGRVLPVCRALCLPDSLDPEKVRGKIVVCTRGSNGRVAKGEVVKDAGGAGMVLCNDAASGDDVIADAHIIPAAHCSYSQCIEIFNYLQSDA